MKTERIFISYARDDGYEHSQTLRKLLEAEDISVWQDLIAMNIGDNWQPQLYSAIEQAKALVMILTPKALTSPMVRQEWVHARSVGTPVFPVTFTDIYKRKDVPRWAKKVDAPILDPAVVGYKDKLDAFLRQLRNPPTPRHVPNMVQRLQPEYVERTALHNAIIADLLDADGASPKKSPHCTVLLGEGGFGKTTLAEAAGLDIAINEAYTGGVFFVNIGESGTGLDDKWHRILQTIGDEKRYADPIEQLKLKLKGDDFLIILDDVWDKAHIEAIMRLEGCNFLITTREPAVAGIARNEKSVHPITEMTEEEARDVLLKYIPEDKRHQIDDIIRADIQALGKQLGEWALLLDIHGSTIREECVTNRSSVRDALDYVLEGLREEGLAPFPKGKDDDTRRHTLRGSMNASLRRYTDEEKQCIYELSIFPTNTPIPQQTVVTLWKATTNITQQQCRVFLRRVAGHFCRFRADHDNEKPIVRFHNKIREYLLGQLTDASAIHQKFLDGYSVAHWHDLPDNEPYLWHNLAYHLIKAGHIADLYPLITDFRWLQAKLNATKDPTYLIADCDLWLDEHGTDDATYETVQLIRSALANASHILIKDQLALAHQLAGRLFRHRKHTGIEAFITTIVPPQGTLYPIDNGYDVLTSAGGMLIATMDKHDNEIIGAMKVENYIISWDESEMLCLWNADAKLIDGPKETLDLPDGMQATVHLGQLYINGELKSHTPPDDLAVTLSDGRRVSWKDNLMFIDEQRIFIGDDTFGAIEVSNNRFISWTSIRTLLLWDVNVEHIEIHTEHELGFGIAKLYVRDGDIISINNKEIPIAVLWKKQGEGNKINFVPEKIENYEGDENEDEGDENQGVIEIRINDETFLRFRDLNILAIEKGSENESQTIARFYGSSPFKEIIFSDGVVVAGDNIGRVLFLRWVE